MRMPQGITSQLANAITLVRILLMPLSLAFLDRPMLFALLWVISGLSDALDGFVARKLDTQSEAGARLDWWADVVMYGVIVLFYWRVIAVEQPRVTAAILLIFAVRMANLGIGYLRFRKIGAVHTIGNKIAGVAVFFAPALYLVVAHSGILWIAVGLALLSALEESILLLRLDDYDPNTRSIFALRRWRRTA